MQTLLFDYGPYKTIVTQLGVPSLQISGHFSNKFLQKLGIKKRRETSENCQQMSPLTFLHQRNCSRSHQIKCSLKPG